MLEYRAWVKTEDLVSFAVSQKETDLMILAESNLEEKARASILRHRKDLEDYITKHPEFKNSLEPVRGDKEAPGIAKAMIRASEKSGVGPMAGVAGAIAEYVGRDLLQFSGQVIVENGGDIFLKTNKERILGIFAGESKFTKRLGLKVKPQKDSLGICASSGKVGHSLSFGATDAAVVVSKNAVLSDCVATRIGNLVKGVDDLQKGINFAKSVEESLGIVIIIGDKLASWGQIELVSI